MAKCSREAKRKVSEARKEKFTANRDTTLHPLITRALPAEQNTVWQKSHGQKVRMETLIART